MKTNLHIGALGALALVLALSAAPAPAMAQGGACLSRIEIQNAVAAGDILPLAQVLSAAGIDSSQDVLSVTVCNQGGELYYVLTVLDAEGNAESVSLNARTGSR